MINLVAIQRRRLLAAMSRKGEAITLRWSVTTGGTLDPTTGAVTGGSRTQQNQVVKGFFYQVEAGGRVKTQKWDVYEEVHALIEIPPDTVIEGRDEIRFEVAGEIYVQAEVADGKKVAKQIELCEGVAMYRTLYLRKS